MKTLAILLLHSFFFLFYGVHSAIITFSNNCAYKVWAATPQFSTTGFELPTGATESVNVTASFNGRFWGRTGCSNDSTGKFICATGDCGSGQISCDAARGGTPPVTLVEFSLTAEGGGRAFYDISLVDGFNVPVSISPRGGSGSLCFTSSCARDVNSDCPNELAVKGQDGNSVIGCKSACLAFKQPEYCCTGSFNSPDTCKSTNYSTFFKYQCPQAYTYPYDDVPSAYSCTSGANYDITFCPDGRVQHRSWGNCPTGFLNFSVYKNNLSFSY